MDATAEREFVRVPCEILKLLIATRSGLPDHAHRMDSTIWTHENMTQPLWRPLSDGVLAVMSDEFKSWYEGERARKKWPSQLSAKKTGRGRPSKQSIMLRNRIMALVYKGKWDGQRDSVLELHRLLLEVAPDQTPSDDTLRRLLSKMYNETGDKRLQARTMRRRQQGRFTSPSGNLC